MTNRFAMTAKELRTAYAFGIRDFACANLYGADLHGANLYGADLYGAEGITTRYGLGEENRFVFCYIHEDTARVQAGCFNGTLAELEIAVKAKYDSDDLHGQDYLAQIATWRIWERIQLQEEKANVD
jgi:uncharacterized protein YjbI with pentapeptide repeats